MIGLRVLVVGLLVWAGGAAAQDAKGRLLRFHNHLSNAEKHFIQTSPLFHEYRRDWIAGLKYNKVFWVEADLNDDGQPERLILLRLSEWCGNSSGCWLRIFTQQGKKGWRELADISAEPEALSLLPETDGGWHRLDYGQEPYYWNGCEYSTASDAEADQRDGYPPCRP